MGIAQIMILGVDADIVIGSVPATDIRIGTTFEANPKVPIFPQLMPKFELESDPAIRSDTTDRSLTGRIDAKPS
jgi:hypothetical protein